MIKQDKISISLILAFLIFILIINGWLIFDAYNHKIEVGKNAATAEQVYQSCLDAIPDNSNLKTYAEYEMSVEDYYNMVENCNKVYERLKK